MRMPLRAYRAGSWLVSFQNCSSSTPKALKSGVCMYPGQRVLSKSHTQVTTWVPRSAGSLGCISVGKG